MKFTCTVNTPEGQTLAVFHGKTQEEANFNARYSGVCVLKFNHMPLDVIESMPESGVPALAIEASAGYDAVEALNGIVAIATKHSEEEWMGLRQKFIAKQKEYDQPKH